MTRVLYAEDDPIVAGVVRTLFKHFAPELTLDIVPNGQACLDRMAQGGVDVLLLDLVLPDIDGLNVLRELVLRGDTTPVIMASGLGQTELAVRALRAGAVDCVDKSSPQFNQIADTVKRVLSRHRQSPPRPANRSVREKNYQLLVIEISDLTRRTIEEFFRVNAPQFTVISATTTAELETYLGPGGRVDAVLIGSTPREISPLDTLRKLHSHHPDLPVLLLSARDDGQTAVAAFKLGAQDYILMRPDFLREVVYSLSNILHRADTERNNEELTRELAALNLSLEALVQARTSELQALSTRLLRIQEDERRAIARDLHDHLGQLLTGLRFRLETLQQTAPANLQDPLQESLNTSDEMLRFLRELTQQLRPRVLDDLGLAPALEWHSNLFQNQTGIAVSLDVSLPPARLPGELETAVFRFVQEALTNVARHSKATAANVTVTTGDGNLIAEVTDRGCGFDVEAKLASHDSIGLIGQRERVSLAGGRMEIFSRPGQGTRIHAEFPLEALRLSNGLLPPAPRARGRPNLENRILPS